MSRNKIAPIKCLIEGCTQPLHTVDITDRYSKVKRPVKQKYCREHWIESRKKKTLIAIKDKIRICKYCGCEDQTLMIITNIGKISCCKACDFKRRSNFTSKFTKDPAYIKKQKEQWYNRTKDLTDDERIEFFSIQSIASKSWHSKTVKENPGHYMKSINKWLIRLESMTPEARKAHFDKANAKRKPITPVEKAEWIRKISETKLNTPIEQKKEALRKRGVTISQMSIEELQTWKDKMSKGVKKFQNEHPERLEQMKEYSIKYWTTGNIIEKKQKMVEKLKKNWANLSKEEKYRRTLLYRHAYFIKNGVKYSKVELECYNYLKQTYPNIIHHKEVGTYVFDFYIPEYNLLINFDGSFWHTYNGKIKNLKDYFNVRKFRVGRSVIKCMKRDRIQNKLYKNLVRITDLEFKKNPQLILDRINNYKLANKLT